MAAIQPGDIRSCIGFRRSKTGKQANNRDHCKRADGTSDAHAQTIRARKQNVPLVEEEIA
jgi:hypothetical protein